MNGEIASITLLNPVLDLLGTRTVNIRGGMEQGEPEKRGVRRPSPENSEITFGSNLDHSVIYTV